MKTIKYSLETSDKWLETLHLATPSTLVNNTLKLLPNFGIGSISTIQIQKGLYVTITDVILNEFITLNRKAKLINDGFIINIYLTNTEVVTNLHGKEVILGVNNNSVVLSSAATSAELVFPAHIPIKVFHIYFSRPWLLEHAIDERSLLNNPVINDKPIYIIENLDYNFSKVKELLIPLSISLNKIKLRSVIYQVLEHLLSKIEKRGHLGFRKLDSKDLTQLMIVRKLIEDKFPEVIPNEDLAKTAGMSLSKFKKVFRQVYGTSPYQYHKTYKMNLALELLKTNQYSVSEVGYSVGYQNLGQFSKAFYKQHNILPRDIN